MFLPKQAKNETGCLAVCSRDRARQSFESIDKKMLPFAERDPAGKKDDCFSSPRSRACWGYLLGRPRLSRYSRTRGNGPYAAMNQPPVGGVSIWILVTQVRPYEPAWKNKARRAEKKPVEEATNRVARGVEAVPSGDETSAAAARSK